jgi:N-methylhydantoinase B
MKALAEAVPSKVSAGVANLKAIAFSSAGSASPWVHIEIFEGSYGGRESSDGMDSVDTLYANTRNNPIEDIESHVPLRVTRYELRENQLSAGRTRGGLNSIKEVELLEDTMVSVEGDGHGHVPWGLNGGSQGATSSLELVASDGSTTALPSMMPARRFAKGSRLRATGGVGGGYGNPRERAEQAVLEDVLDGLLDREAAAREFGVAITEAMTIDEAGTLKLRAS